MKDYDLGTEKIGRLVRHFSVPCVISMLVAALRKDFPQRNHSYLLYKVCCNHIKTDFA